MKELIELVFRDTSTMFFSFMVIWIVSYAIWKILDSVLRNIFGRGKKTKIKKVYVDEFGDEIDK